MVREPATITAPSERASIQVVSARIYPVRSIVFQTSNCLRADDRGFQGGYPDTIVVPTGHARSSKKGNSANLATPLMEFSP
jgi:hypothetical protein